MRRNELLRRELWVLAGLSVLIGCSKEENNITLSSDTDVEVYSVTNQSETVKFTAESSWKASCTAKWLIVSPNSGEAGAHSITVSTTETNRTGNTRTAQLVITAGGQSKTITVKQRNEYAVFEADELNLQSGESTISVRVRTNMELDKISLYATDGLLEWFTPQGHDNSRTRVENQGVIPNIKVSANTSVNPREGAICLTMDDKNGKRMGLDTLFIYQDGMDNGYQSTDFSARGRVEQLNKSTVGKGIPIVLMGDGFVDEEIADSSYAKVMRQAMENLFSEEPIKSLRDYFDVYQVTAVSPRNRFDGVQSTVFGTVPNHQTMGIEVDMDSVMKYVKKVENIDSVNTLAVVILNSSLNKGVTYMMASNKYDYNYAVALCPVIDSLKSETFRQVLTHEAVGHGFAKLADEYVRSTEGSATDADIKRLKERHDKWDWFLNVDAERDSTKVLWTKMIYDSEFADEKIGIYEGGYTFFKGVYRSTEGSMMNQNDSPFNAPSRQAIYNKVMKMAHGRTPSYDEFVTFDKAHKPEVWSYRLRTRQSVWETPWRPAPPRIIYVP